MGGEGGARARILVVDDSRLMRKAAQKMLGEEFDVVLAEDGEQAWTLVSRDPSLQVVFTDLNMPLCDGYELLGRIRGSGDSWLQTLPVIVVTGADNDEAARMQALDMGATDFIVKPFSTTDLVARARAHANNQRITRQLQAQSTLDGLTGLANQAGFLERLQQDIAYARRHQQPLSVVRLEIEEFRRFFLYYGRDVAESLVLQVARLVRARIRKEDTAARIGLGGFALSLPGGGVAGIESMLDRLRSEMAAQPPMDDQGEAIRVVLRSVVLDPVLVSGDGAQSVFDQCQALLDAVPEGVAAPSPAPAPAPEPMAVPVDVQEADATEVAEPPAALSPEPTPAPAEPLLIDPLLDQMAAGNPRPLAEKLPQVIGRLLPLFRLLGPKQRAQLIQFLQKLG
jgi:diguanylate cyclase (GGDEF)-like protein